MPTGHVGLGDRLKPGCSTRSTICCRNSGAYPIGFFHIDTAQISTEHGKLHLFVAVDRTSKFAFVQLHENPKLQPHVNIELDPSQIIAAQQAIVERNPGDVQHNLQLDPQSLGVGTYSIFYLDRQGDSRGGDWFDISLCIGRGQQVGPSQTHLGYYLQQHS